MRASEIVNKLKDVLLSSTEVEKVEETTIENEVELKDSTPKSKKEVESKSVTENANEETPKQEDDVREVSYSAEEVLAENPMEDTQEEIVEEAPKYATVEEVAEIKAMVEAKEETSPEVPQELSSDEVTEPLAHSPENEVSEKLGIRYSTNARQNTTYSRVLNAISNN